VERVFSGRVTSLAAVGDTMLASISTTATVASPATDWDVFRDLYLFRRTGASPSRKTL
jgi:hypothetical protein